MVAVAVDKNVAVSLADLLQNPTGGIGGLAVAPGNGTGVHLKIGDFSHQRIQRFADPAAVIGTAFIKEIFRDIFINSADK